MITIIVAYDENRVIGKDGKIPWHLPEDFRHFKKTTMGAAIIMGRKTHESLPCYPGFLPGRLNVVVSRSGSHPNLESAIQFCKEQGKEIFLIGGGQIYESALNNGCCGRILASEIEGKHDGDVFFPELGGDWGSKLIEEYPGFKVMEYIRGIASSTITGSTRPIPS